MMTSERALGLADELDNMLRGEASEAAAILRHYAEILPKWQAVLDAEPVAEVCLNYSDDDRYKHTIDYSRSEIDSIAVGTQLIIKPGEPA